VDRGVPSIYASPTDETRLLGAGSQVRVNGVDATVIAPMTAGAKQYDAGAEIVSVYPLLFPSGEVRFFSRSAFEWDPDHD
jgi:hypothetical protein